MKNKDITLILVSIFIVISAWVTFNIIHSGAQSTISEDLNRNIIPINPNFDTKTIDALKKRTIVSPIYSLSSEQEKEATKGGSLNEK